MAKILSLFILTILGSAATANPVLDYISANFHKSERWPDAAMPEKDVAAHAPIELRATRASCDTDFVEGKSVVMVNGEDKTELRFERKSAQQASTLLLNCGRAVFRAQQADGPKGSKIAFRQFINDDPNLPSSGFLVDPPRVSIKRNPFLNLGYMIYIDGKLPIAAVSPMPGALAKLEAALEDAKVNRKLVALDWSHPVDAKNHPLIDVRDGATSALDAPPVVSPASAN